MRNCENSARFGPKWSCQITGGQCLGESGILCDGNGNPREGEGMARERKYNAKEKLKEFADDFVKTGVEIAKIYLLVEMYLVENGQLDKFETWLRNNEERIDEELTYKL